MSYFWIPENLLHQMDGLRNIWTVSQHLPGRGVENITASIPCRLRNVCMKFANHRLMYHSSALSTLTSWLYSIAQHYQDHTAQSIQMVMVSSERKNESHWPLELVQQVRNLLCRLLQRVLAHVIWRIFQISVRLLESSMIIKLKPGKIHHHISTCCTSTTELPRTVTSSSIYIKTTVQFMSVQPKSWIHLDHQKCYSGIRTCA